MKGLLVSRSRWLKATTALLLAVVVVLGLVAVGTAGAKGPTGFTAMPDGYEFDDNMGAAKPIEINGAPQAHTISSAGDIDWVKFDARAGSVYVADVPDYTNVAANETVPVPSGVSATVLLELYNSQGTLLYTTRNQLYTDPPMTGSGSLAKRDVYPWQSTLVWKAPANGTYYIRVVPYTQAPWGGVGDYLLRLRNVNASITGKVTYADTGKPAPYTFVAAEPYGPEQAGPSAKNFWAMATYTDANGDYILYNLGQGIDYEVWFDAEDDEVYQPEYWDGKHDADVMNAIATPTPLFLGNADPVTANASLDLYAPSISGKVVQENGQPASGVTVYAQMRPAGTAAKVITTPWSTITDSNGNYALRNLGDGEWIINFVDDEREPLPPRYISEWWDDQSSSVDADGIDVVLGAAEGSYNATLAPNPLVASGSVKDKSGAPVAYADVKLYSQDPPAEAAAKSEAPAGYSFFGSAETNEDGNWEYRATDTSEALKAAVDFTAHDWPQYQEQWYSLKKDGASANAFAAKSSAPASNINFVLDNVDPFLSGTVTDAITGARLPGIQVWAYIVNGWGDIVPFEYTTTDASGNYRFQELWYPGNGSDDVFVGFFDTSGMYAQEYWDNEQQLNLADDIYVGYMSNQVANAALMPKPGRIYGPDRYSTASNIAANRFPGWAGVKNVVVASGDDAAASDPLAAASLCWAYDAPMLLTSVREPNAQSTIATMKQVKAVNPAVKVYVVGGPNSVPQVRIDELTAIVGAGNVERLPYGDRYETAKQIALRGRKVAIDASKPIPDFAIVANGADTDKFGDALSSSAISGANGAPILLVTETSIPGATTSALASLTPAAVYVAGGPASVNAAVYSGLGAKARMWGPNRYSTSVAIAQTAFDKAWLYVEKIGIAARIPDALTGGVNMGYINGPLLVTKTSSLPGETYAFLHKYNQIVNEVVVFGGPKSVTPAVKTQVDQALVHP